MEKVIWITGASSGIGAELARQYANHKGVKLILSARRKSVLEEVKVHCNPNAEIRILPLDLMEFEKAAQYVKAALKCFGRIDMLINNGGISQRSLIAETDFNVFKKLVEVDYLGQVALSTALLPYFVENKSGHFVVVSSIMGKFASPFRSGYCGAKHALHGFFDALRMEHTKDGIDVTMICPGFVQTQVTVNALTGDGRSLGQNDPATQSGLAVDYFCKKMIRAVDQKKWEKVIAKKEKWGVFLRPFSSRLLQKIVLKSNVR